MNLKAENKNKVEIQSKLLETNIHFIEFGKVT